MKVVVELDHRRTANAAKICGKRNWFKRWEYRALSDVSEQLGVEDTFFIECSATYMDRRFTKVLMWVRSSKRKQASKLY
jgi:hypothetical protein